MKYKIKAAEVKHRLYQRNQFEDQVFSLCQIIWSRKHDSILIRLNIVWKHPIDEDGWDVIDYAEPQRADGKHFLQGFATTDWSNIAAQIVKYVCNEASWEPYHG